MKALQEPRTLSVTLILGAETFKAGEGCPSPREGQLSPCAYHLSHSLSSIHWRPPCPQVLDHSAPHPAQSGWRRAQHPHHSSPGMVVQAGGSFPPLLPHSLLCPSAHSPSPDMLSQDSPASRCQPGLGHAELLTVTPARGCSYRPAPTPEGSCEPLLPRDPSPPASPHAASHCTIDKSLMSFALTSSQINTLHVVGVGRGGPTAPGKSQPLGEKRLQGHGQEGGQSKRA